MRPRASLVPLLLTAALGGATACGGSTAHPSSSPPDGSPPGQEPVAGHGVLVASTSAGQLGVLHVDAAAGAARPYGPSLPGPGADVAAISSIWSSPDLARVLVMVSTGGTAVGATGTSALYAGDGTSWRAIEMLPFAADGAVGRIVVSADASILRTYDTGERLLGFDGTTVYSFAQSTQFATFAPDSSYFLYVDNNDGTIHSRTPGGSDHVVAPPSSIQLPETLETIFATSLIVFTDTTGGDLPAQGPGQLNFVDLEGHALSVSGFDSDPSVLNVDLTSRASTTPSNIVDRFEVAGGRVARLVDRGAQPLGSVPAPMGAQNVLLADEEGTFVVDGSAWELLDAAGHVKSTFQPPDPVLCANVASAPSPDVQLLLASLDTSPRWALLQVGHAIAGPGCAGGPHGPIGETDDVLWDMDGNRTQVLDARPGDTSWYGPEYQPSPDGTSLVWIHAAGLNRFRIPSFTGDTIPSAAVPVETLVHR
jgi:hypothetical protein